MAILFTRLRNPPDSHSAGSFESHIFPPVSCWIHAEGICTALGLSDLGTYLCLPLGYGVVLLGNMFSRGFNLISCSFGNFFELIICIGKECLV